VDAAQAVGGIEENARAVWLFGEIDFAGVAQKLGRGEAGENAADAVITELRRAG